LLLLSDYFFLDYAYFHAIAIDDEMRLMMLPISHAAA